ncbi:General transcription factor IIE subunit [Fasciola hepatica]|uniref:General transcription factor IIE subunit n=1 Tax=Fasciola hepatica TaxID=6192 RepID=A0A4E0RGM4_FASHE|nr:General transcription factor IIE subunit [Fasciola hepatica]
MSIAATAANASFSLSQNVASPSRTSNEFSNVNLADNETHPSNIDSRKRPPTISSSVAHTSSSLPAKRPNPSHVRIPTSDTNRTQKSTSEVPACLERLVRTIVRMFYSREHSLIVDMLVRNTIMKENDLCERLRFEEKQLRQYLRTLKQDQLIKSKLQLETDASGKTTKITHYFIEYKLFVNIVKYRLDQVQRRLEAEQRKTTSRATFKCPSCAMTYTDLEVDRLLDPENPGRLICVYCQAEVVEEKDNVSRTDARALIAKFHHQVREPIDNMLRECDAVHLSSSILEPEIRPLEPLNEDAEMDYRSSDSSRFSLDSESSASFNRRNDTQFGPTESRVRIVLTGQSDKGSQNTKARPIWMADSTINSGPMAGLGELDRGSGTDFGSTQFSSSSDQTAVLGSSSNESLTQTLAPGRVPTGFSTASGSSGGLSSTVSADLQSSNPTGVSTATSSDIMQLLLVHERRRMANQHSGKSTHLVPKNRPIKNPVPPSFSDRSTGNKEQGSPESNDKPQLLVCLGGRMIPYAEITGSMIKTMTPQERAEYVRVGKQLYMDVMMQ